MTDAELIAGLRDLAAVLGKEAFTCAADRIEELIAERNDWESHAVYNAEFVDIAVSYRNERDAARSKLAKAEEELELQEEEACMMENSYFELEKELNTCRMAQAVMDNTVDALEAKLAKAEWLLTDAAVQLEEGKIKTRRNRAGLIWQFLAEIKAT